MASNKKENFYRLAGIFSVMELLRPQAKWEMYNNKIVKWEDSRPQPTIEEIEKVKKLAEEFEDNIKPIFLPEQIEKMRALQRHENPDIKEYIRK